MLEPCNHDGILSSHSIFSNAAGLKSLLRLLSVGIERIVIVTGPLAEPAYLTTRHLCYEMDCLVSASKLKIVSCPVVEDLVWCEIDDETHLARAREDIYPIVQQQDLELVLSERHQSQGQLARPRDQ